MKNIKFKKIKAFAYTLFFLIVLAIPLHATFAQATGTCSNPLFTAPDTCTTNGGNWTPTSTSGNCSIPGISASGCAAAGGFLTPISGSAAGSSTTPSAGTYVPLAPLPGFTSFDPSQSNALSTYINIIIHIVIGVIAVLAMIMIVMGGIQYMTSDVISSKEEGKKRIWNAVIGLLIALSAYLILFTINPNLLKTIDTNDQNQLPTGSFLDSDGDTEGTASLSGDSSTATIDSLQALGITCPGTGGTGALVQIAESFVGHVTYSNSPRDTVDTTVNPATVYLDCSSFVAQVYACAGLPNPTGSLGNTSGIFASNSPVPSNADGSVNTNALQVGDLVGWTSADNVGGQGLGHVLMYIGNGQFINATGCGKGNNCYVVAPNASVKVTSAISTNIAWVYPPR